MTAVGWREGRFTHDDFIRALMPTYTVLLALDCLDHQGQASDAGMDLATAALSTG